MNFQDLSHSEISKKIIDILPGIFYLYEKVDDQVLLKWWNDNHVKIFGYSDEELLNKPGFTFFTETEYKRITEEIESAFINGYGQIRTQILTKSGKQIPHLLEALTFVDHDRYYLMGVGIDIASQVKAEKSLEKSNVERQKLEQEKVNVLEQLETKKRELITIAVESGKTNEINNATIKKLNEIINNHPENEVLHDLIKLRTNLKLQIKDQKDWEIFKLSFIEVHNDFIKNLHNKHPELTKSELRFCAYLRINLSSSQIATIQNVTLGAIKQTRYRLRKKIGLVTKDSLENYFLKF